MLIQGMDKLYDRMCLIQWRPMVLRPCQPTKATINVKSRPQQSTIASRSPPMSWFHMVSWRYGLLKPRLTNWVAREALDMSFTHSEHSSRNDLHKLFLCSTKLFLVFWAKISALEGIHRGEVDSPKATLALCAQSSCILSPWKSNTLNFFFDL